MFRQYNEDLKRMQEVSDRIKKFREKMVSGARVKPEEERELKELEREHEELKRKINKYHL